MPMILAQKLRACVVCTYLMEQEVIDPLGEVVNGCRIKCCWYPNQDITGDQCENCPHFDNIHRQLGKGGDDYVKKAVETHPKASTLAGNRPGKGQNPRSGTKSKGHPTQLELDQEHFIKT